MGKFLKSRAVGERGKALSECSVANGLRIGDVGGARLVNASFLETKLDKALIGTTHEFTYCNVTKGEIVPSDSQGD